MSFASDYVMWSPSISNGTTTELINIARDNVFIRDAKTYLAADTFSSPHLFIRINSLGDDDSSFARIFPEQISDNTLSAVTIPPTPPVAKSHGHFAACTGESIFPHMTKSLGGQTRSLPTEILVHRSPGYEADINVITIKRPSLLLASTSFGRYACTSARSLLGSAAQPLYDQHPESYRPADRRPVHFAYIHGIKEMVPRA